MSTMGLTDAQQVQVSLEVPVLIAGGGPSGLLAAYLLSKLGVKSLVVEKYPQRLSAPKAHALCPRTLEICRQFGLDTAALRRRGTCREDAYWVNFLTNLSGEQIGVLPYERMDPEVLDDTPEMIHNIPQPQFEKFIAEHLKDDPNVEIRKGVGFVSCDQNDSHVVTTVEERDTKTTYHVHSRYVIGCDGAKSQVRKHLGIESDGEDSYETMMTIHFHADLRPLVGERVGMLHWNADPGCSGFIIAYDLSGNQVLISNFDAARRPAAQWTEADARAAVRAALGPGRGSERSGEEGKEKGQGRRGGREEGEKGQGVMDQKEVVGEGGGQAPPAFRVLSFRPWVLSRRVARRYHDGRTGRVLLAGDAAHAFPPTGGLGLNTGLADVHNLAWKMALAVKAEEEAQEAEEEAQEAEEEAQEAEEEEEERQKKEKAVVVGEGSGSGSAPERVRQRPMSLMLAETYDAERRPVAEVCAQQSVKNGRRIFSFLKALGTAGIEDVEQARASLLRTIRDPAKQGMIREEVEGQREHFDNLEIHIGYVYGQTEPPAHASHYTPKFVAGARLPHAWIRLPKDNTTTTTTTTTTSSDNSPVGALPPVDVSYVREFSAEAVAARRYSTLDLCAPDGFTLLVGARSPLRPMGAARWGGSGVQGRVRVRVWAAGEDFDLVDVEDEGGRRAGADLKFAARAGWDVGGGLLVRPDQHLLRVLGPGDSCEDVEGTIRGYLSL